MKSMKTKFLKMLSFISAIVVASSLVVIIPVSANNVIQSLDFANNDNLKQYAPNEVILRGPAKPTNEWNISSKGQYNMQGSSSTGDNLYTEYYFTGKTGYALYMVNSGTTNFKYEILKHSNNASIHSGIVNAGESYTIAFGTSSTSEGVYIKFSTPYFFAQGFKVGAGSYIK